MLEHLNREIYSAGEQIFREGDPGDCAYLIDEGIVGIFAINGDREQLISRIGAGEVFGEVALIDHQPRTATVRALERTVVVPIRRQLVNEILEKTDPIIRHLLLVILERFRSTGSPSRPPGHPPEETVKLRHSLRGEAAHKLTLAHDITHALTSNEFELHYQPICELSTGKVAGFEALIRWNHPRNGMIPPLDFLWLAEQTGQIRDIGLWTLEQACRDWPILRRHAEHKTPFVSVNLSASQLTGDRFVEEVKAILIKYDMPSTELKLELTETVIINCPELASQLLGQLTELGNSLALDDFGTGYSGLDSLQRYPIATMKIDRTFISTMNSSAQSREIVHSSIKLAHSMGIDVVAEGIETNEVRYKLLELKCDFGQGWHFGRPAQLSSLDLQKTD